MKALYFVSMAILFSVSGFSLEKGNCSASKDGVVLDTKVFDERTVLTLMKDVNPSNDMIAVVDSDEVTPTLEVWTSTQGAFFRDPQTPNKSEKELVLSPQGEEASVLVDGYTITCRNY